MGVSGLGWVCQAVGLARLHDKLHGDNKGEDQRSSNSP